MCYRCDRARNQDIKEQQSTSADVNESNMTTIQTENAITTPTSTVVVLKSILIWGPNFHPPVDIVKAMQRSKDYIVIGDGKTDISSEVVSDALQGYIINDHTRIDLCFHGNIHNGHHIIGTTASHVNYTKDIFANLVNIYGKDQALNIHLWSCKGGKANDDAWILPKGSVVISHTDYLSSLCMLDNDEQYKSWKNFINDDSNAKRQFLDDILSDHSTQNITVVKEGGTAVKYSTKSFLMPKLIKQLISDPDLNLKALVEYHINTERQQYEAIVNNRLAQYITLDHEQYSNYVVGQLCRDMAILQNINSNELKLLLPILVKQGVDLYTTFLGHGSISLGEGSFRENFTNILRTQQNIDDAHKVPSLWDDVNTSTALIDAIKGNHYNLAKKLIADNSNILEQQDHVGNNPLHVAVNNEDYKAVGFLIQHGSNINATNSNFHTALHIAVEKSCVWAVEELIRHGCDINISNEDGYTAMDILIQKTLGTSDGVDLVESIEILQLLTQSGGVINDDLTKLYEHYNKNGISADVLSKIFPNITMHINSNESDQEVLVVTEGDRAAILKQIDEYLTSFANDNSDLQENIVQLAQSLDSDDEGFEDDNIGYEKEELVRVAENYLSNLIEKNPDIKEDVYAFLNRVKNCTSEEIKEIIENENITFTQASLKWQNEQNNLDLFSSCSMEALKEEMELEGIDDEVANHEILA